MSRRINFKSPSSISTFRHRANSVTTAFPDNGALNHADAFWLSAETLDRIEALMPTITEVDPAKMVRLSGMAMFERPVNVPLSEPMDGLVWFPVKGGEMGLHHFTVNGGGTHFEDFIHHPCNAELLKAGFSVLTRRYGPLRPGDPVSEVLARKSDIKNIDANFPPLGRHLMRFVVAMHQVLREEASTEPLSTGAPKGSRKWKRSHKRRSSQHTSNYVVNLRGSALPSKTVEVVEPSEPTGRHIGVRYEVREHTRNQAYGPGRSLRRLITVPAHVRGPEDAPFRPKNYRVAAA